MINLFDDEQINKKSETSYGSGEHGKDGLFRVDMSKVSEKNKNRGYRVELRFLPNAITNPEIIKSLKGEDYDEERDEMMLGNNFFRKSTHYVNIPEIGVNGYFDEPTNIDPKTGNKIAEKSPLAETFFATEDSTNAVVRSRRTLLQWRQKWYSYVLIINDEQRPEYNGKIMILEYGKGIYDAIKAEEKGEGISGDKANAFSLNSGKNFTLISKDKTWKNNQGKEITTPNYDNSGFSGSVGPIQIPVFDEDGSIKKWIIPPVDENGTISSEIQAKIVKFLTTRDLELESFGAQPWSDNQQKQVSDIISYVMAKSQTPSNEPTADEFSFDDATDTAEEVADMTSDDDSWDDF